METPEIDVVFSSNSLFDWSIVESLGIDTDASVEEFANDVRIALESDYPEAIVTVKGENIIGTRVWHSLCEEGTHGWEDIRDIIARRIDDVWDDGHFYQFVDESEKERGMV